MRNRICCAIAVVLVLALSALSSAHAQQPVGYTNQIPATFTPPPVDADYDKRVVMVPMRDGVKLYTVIVVPKSATAANKAPIVMTRTCYNAAARAQRSLSPHMAEALPLSDEGFADAGYIRVYQDVRGKYGSEGPYLMTPPPVGSGFNATGADDTTDAYDTIDWLVKNVPESNGRVGMIGSSYEGFTVVMALLHPHPALVVAAPESPMIDGWMGDDWFHYGAFRQTNYDYFLGQTTQRGAGTRVPHPYRDDYTTFLEAGSGGDYARSMGLDQLPYWKTVEAHPAYDAFWQSQALDKLIAKTPLTVPTMWEQGLWDQEDMWGAIHSYRAWEPQDKANDKNFLVMGPWRHSQINREGRMLGPFTWATDTTAQWRHDVLLPFFNQYLRPGAPKANTPPVWIYDPGLDHWDTYASFPTSCEKGCVVKSRPLYLQAKGGLAFTAPGHEDKVERYDEYVSDPVHPVPFRPRPIAGDDGGWGNWLLMDQRFVDGRPDVVTYMTEPLAQPLKLSGEPVVHLFASTSGTDSDWAVKLIDVFPERGTAPTDMNGYELPIGTDIFRGRYRTSFEHPAALKPNEPQEFTFGLPMVNYTVAKGHRIMVQVQSTLFPLYDRNPQTFVPNIFDAKPADYIKATQRIWHSGKEASYVSLPVVQ
jgi:putative CocE/NonD family hydrolase